ncbi:MAG TPA: HNH endonuclease family protein [Candidatus Sulfotelmatobacter sp.]
MKDVIPGDAEFEKEFANAKISKAYLARYYLNVLEKQKAGEKEPELVPNANEAEVNLEHVLPQNPSSGTWAAFDEDARSAFTHRLGNLALMKVSDNTQSGTEEFSDKKQRYAKSNFVLTKMIADYTDWTSKEIEDRQRQLATLALAAWPQKP